MFTGEDGLDGADESGCSGVVPEGGSSGSKL